MRYFDLHCDTLVACLDQNKSLIDNDLHVSVKKGDRFAPVCAVRRRVAARFGARRCGFAVF